MTLALMGRMNSTWYVMTLRSHVVICVQTLLFRLLASFHRNIYHNQPFQPNVYLSIDKQ